MRLDIKRLAKDRYAEYLKSGHLLDPMEAEEYDEIVETAERIVKRCGKSGEITPRQKEILTDVHDYLRSFGGYAYKVQWMIEDLLNDFETWFEKDRRNGRMLDSDVKESRRARGRMLREYREGIARMSRDELVDIITKCAIVLPSGEVMIYLDDDSEQPGYTICRISGNKGLRYTLINHFKKNPDELENIAGRLDVDLTDGIEESRKPRGRILKENRWNTPGLDEIEAEMTPSDLRIHLEYENGYPCSDKIDELVSAWGQRSFNRSMVTKLREFDSYKKNKKWQNMSEDELLEYLENTGLFNYAVYDLYNRSKNESRRPQGRMLKESDNIEEVKRVCASLVFDLEDENPVSRRNATKRLEDVGFKLVEKKDEYDYFEHPVHIYAEAHYDSRNRLEYFDWSDDF